MAPPVLVLDLEDRSSSQLAPVVVLLLRRDALPYTLGPVESARFTGYGTTQNSSPFSTCTVSVERLITVT